MSAINSASVIILLITNSI